MIDEADQRLAQLERRVLALEAELAEMRAASIPTSISAPAPGPLHQPPPPPPVGSRPLPGPFTAPPRPVPSGPTRTLDDETILKWSGVALVVLAVAFAVSTAIRRGWVGPWLQLTGALLVSGGLIATGLRLRPRRPAWTHALCLGGVAAAQTTIASNLFVEQAGDTVALAATAVVAGGAYGLARFVPSEWVGAAALVGSLSGWAFLADADTRVEASWLFGTVVVFAAIGLALSQRWHALRLAGHLTALVWMLGLAEDSDEMAARALLVLGALAVTLSLLWVPGIGDRSSRWQLGEMQLAGLVAPWLLGLTVATFDIADDDLATGGSALAIAAVIGASAVALRSHLVEVHRIALLVGVSVTVSIGLAVLLDTPAAFLALAIQGAGLVVMAASLDGDRRILANAAVLLGLSSVYATAAMVSAWDTDAPIGDDLAHLAIIAAVSLAIWRAAVPLLVRIGSVVALAALLLWIGSLLVHLPQGQAAVSVSWAALGIAVLVGGARRKLPDLGVAGLAVLGVTIAKLLTVDLREVDALWRAGLFFVIGAGVLRLGFLLPRLTGTDEPRTSG